MNKYKNVLLTIGCFLSLCSFARITLPSVIDNNMVLQQQTKVMLWGTATGGSNVSVKASWDNGSYAVKAAADGAWKVYVQTPVAGGPYTITFSDGEKLVLSNILIGEVWLCSGQSNMEMPVKGFRNQPTAGSNEMLMEAGDDGIRLFRLERNMTINPLTNAKASGWQEDNAESAKEMSAVAYQFAKMLRERLKVPIGIVATYWGGTMIEGWMSEASLQTFPEVKIPKDTIGMTKNTPTVLFNAMIHPLIGFGIKGMLWYQGEQNRMEPDLYEKLFPAMVADWRKLWNIGEFPFYYVQIAPWVYPDKRELVPVLREAQFKSASRIPSSGMVVTMDIGDDKTIHPSDKKTVSRRLAYWALAKTYGKKGLLYENPSYKSMKVTVDTVNLQFENAPNGFTSFGKEPTAFEVAGADKVFHPAKALITSRGIAVVSPQVKTPVAVRYAFKDWVVGDMYNVEGLPLAPFRTDNW